MGKSFRLKDNNEIEWLVIILYINYYIQVPTMLYYTIPVPLSTWAIQSLLLAEYQSMQKKGDGIKFWFSF